MRRRMASIDVQDLPNEQIEEIYAYIMKDGIDDIKKSMKALDRYANDFKRITKEKEKIRINFEFAVFYLMKNTTEGNREEAMQLIFNKLKLTRKDYERIIA